MKSKPAYAYADGGLATGGGLRKGCNPMHLRTAESGGKRAATAAAAPAAAPPAVAVAPVVKRWASAPELHAIAGDLIGTREQVLACLQLQDQFRARRSPEAQLVAGV